MRLELLLAQALLSCAFDSKALRALEVDVDSLLRSVGPDLEVSGTGPVAVYPATDINLPGNHQCVFNDDETCGACRRDTYTAFNEGDNNHPDLSFADGPIPFKYDPTNVCRCERYHADWAAVVSAEPVLTCTHFWETDDEAISGGNRWEKAHSLGVDVGFSVEEEPVPRLWYGCVGGVRVITAADVPDPRYMSAEEKAKFDAEGQIADPEGGEAFSMTTAQKKKMRKAQRDASGTSTQTTTYTLQDDTLRHLCRTT
jgi:hypothetical protein